MRLTLKYMPVIFLLAGCCHRRFVTATPPRPPAEYRTYWVKAPCRMPTTIYYTVSKIPGVANSAGGDNYSIGVLKAPGWRWSQVEPEVVRALEVACKAEPKP